MRPMTDAGSTSEPESPIAPPPGAFVRVQAGFYRAKALEYRGEFDAARRVLRATERFAAARGMAQYQVQAGELRDELGTAEPPPRPVGRAPDPVREELRQLASV